MARAASFEGPLPSPVVAPNEPGPPMSVSVFGISLGQYAGPLCPSYQYTVTGGISPRAGNSKRVTVVFGNVNELRPSCFTSSTLVGLASFRAMLGAPRMWHAISPIDPHPKSRKPRQLKGW